MFTHQCWQLLIRPRIHFTHESTSGWLCIYHMQALRWVPDEQRWTWRVWSLHLRFAGWTWRGGAQRGICFLAWHDLVYNLSLYSIYTNSFRREGGTLEKSSPGEMGHSVWHKPRHSSLHTKHPGGRNHSPERLLHNFYLGPIVRWGPEVKLLLCGFS